LDIKNTEFEKDWATFSTNGSLLEITRKWEDSIPYSQTIKLKNKTQLTLTKTGILSVSSAKGSNISTVISSAVHGNETAPIEILDSLVKKIVQGDIQVKTNLLLIIGNPPAMNIGKRFLTQNLNRLFSQKHKESETQDYETGRAEEIEREVKAFYEMNSSTKGLKRYHFDLHTAIRASKFKKFVVYPYQGNRPWNKEHIAFFGGADITTVLLGNQPAGTFSYYTSNQFGADSATVELGKVKPFGENDMDEFEGIINNLISLIEDKPTKLLKFDNDRYRVFQVKQEIIKANENFKLLVDDNLKNFTSFDKGHLLASDDANEKYVVENDGEAIVFPNNNVPVGQRVAVLLEEVSL